MSYSELYQIPSGMLPDGVLLAHYTSVENVINIVKSEELWMSHPRHMNDWEELNAGIRVVGDVLLHKTSSFGMVNAYREAVAGFVQLSHYLDTYAFCFSEHDIDNQDGILSMWRGYGHQGRGACIVFNTKFMKPDAGDDPLLYVMPVKYVSDKERWSRAEEIVDVWLKCHSNPDVGAEYIGREFDYLLDRALFYALWTKHQGFKEEREVRLGYFSGRDHKQILSAYTDYDVGRQGIQVRLKLPIKPLPGDTHRGWSFREVVHSIIIGPAYSSELARGCLCRAFEKIGKGWLVEKVHASSIPLRANL